MKTNPVISVLLWLSKTDPQLYVLCPQNVKWTRTTLGLFVLLTGLFAMVTGGFFIRSMFSTYNELTKEIEVSLIGWIVSLILGTIWGMFVVVINRKIVSSHSKWGAIISIPLAIVLGLSIAIPFKVFFFSDTINREITKAIRVKNLVYVEKINSTVNGINNKIKTLEEKIETERSEMAKWSSIMEAETLGRVQSGRTGKSGKGPAWEEAKRYYSLHKSFEQQYITELNKLREGKNKIIAATKVKFGKAKINQSVNFLSLYEQLEIIKGTNKSLANFTLLLTMLFVLIEIIPALLKLFKNSDEYDTLLDERINIAKQMAFNLSKQ